MQHALIVIDAQQLLIEGNAEEDLFVPTHDDYRG